MTEACSSYEVDRGLTTHTTLYMFAGCVLLNPWLTSAGAYEDVASAIEMHLDPGVGYWATGEPITPQEQLHVTSMSIMQQLALHFFEGTEIALTPPIPEGSTLTDHAQTVIHLIGLDFINPIDNTLGNEIRRVFFGKEHSDDVRLQPIVEVLSARGTITQEFFSNLDMELALDGIHAGRIPATDEISSVVVAENGDIISGKPLPETPTWTEDIPFYTQYVSEQKGAYDLLMAFLEDLQAIVRKSIGY